MSKKDRIVMDPVYVSYGEFFHTLDWEKIKVPLYQRMYSWKYKNEGKQLLNDMIMIAESNNTKDHFLGIMLVKDEENQNKKQYCTLVDGQQRLTTITLILKSLVSNTIKDEFSYTHPFENEDAIKVRELFDGIKNKFSEGKNRSVFSSLVDKERHELSNWEDVFTWLKNIIENIYLKKNNNEFVLGLQEDELYKAIMNDDKDKFKNKEHSNSFMKDTYEEFEEFSLNKFKSDQHFKYIKYAISIVTALTNLYLVVIKLDKEHLLERDYQIFNDINSKGKKLEQYELIKAKIMSKNTYLNQEDKEHDLKKLDENFNTRIFKDQYKRFESSSMFQGPKSFHNEFFAYYIAFYNPKYFRKIVKPLMENNTNEKELDASLENISVDYIDILKKIFNEINNNLKKIDNSFKEEYWLSEGEVVFGDKEFKLMENHMAVFSTLWNSEDFKKLLSITSTKYQEESFFELTPYERIPIGKIMFWYCFKSINPTNAELHETTQIIKIIKLIGQIRSFVGNKPNVEGYPFEINKVISRNGAVKPYQNNKGGLFYDINLEECKNNLLDLFKGSSSSSIKVPSKDAFRKALQGNNEEGKDNQWNSAAKAFLAMINKNSDISIEKPTLNKLIPTDHETFIKVKNQTKEEDGDFELIEGIEKRYNHKQIGNFFFYKNSKEIEERTYYTKRTRILDKSDFNSIQSDDKDKDYLALPFLDNIDEKKLSYDNICQRTDIITNSIIEEIEKIIGKGVWRDE